MPYWNILWVLMIFSFQIQVLHAQPPQRFSYQTVVRDLNGDLVSNQNVSFRLSLRSGTAGGPVQYQETHLAMTNEFGLVTLQVGGGTVVSGTFATITWGTNTMFLGIEVDITGGTNYIAIGTSQLLSVPYALNAPPDADWTISGTNLYSAVSGKVGIGTTNPSYKLHVETIDANPILYIRNNGGGRGIKVNTQSSCAIWVENSGNHGLRVTHAQGNGVNITAAHGNGIHVEQADGWAGYFVGTGYFSGNVGIGSLAPGAKLHVDGNIIASDPTLPNHVATKNYVDLNFDKYACKLKELEESLQRLTEENLALKEQIKQLLQPH